MADSDENVVGDDGHVGDVAEVGDTPADTVMGRAAGVGLTVGVLRFFLSIIFIISFHRQHHLRNHPLLSLLCLVLSGVGQPEDLHDANLIVEVTSTRKRMI